MNLSKVKHVFKKARRGMFGQAPDMRGVTSVTSVTKRSNGKHIIQVQHELWGQISFYLGSRPITIHGEVAVKSSEGKEKDYLNKLHKLETILVTGLVWLEEKNPGRLVVREFLNEIKDDNDYGSAVMITIPPIDQSHLFCTFEISSCHFKCRQNPDRKELKRQLKFMLKHLRIHIQDYNSAIDIWSQQRGK